MRRELRNQARRWTVWHRGVMSPFWIFGLCAVMGCATQPASEEASLSSAKSVSQSVRSEASADTSTAGSDDAAVASGTKLILGTDQTFAEMPPRVPVNVYGDAVSLNFEEAPLSEVVHSILGDTLGLDYVVEHPVEGEVTLRTRSPVARADLLSILETLLLNNGVLLVRGPDDRFFVSAADSASSMAPSFQSALGQGSGYTNIVVPLQYVSATEMADILSPVAPESAFVRVDERRNLLVLGGTQTQISGWLSIVATFDVDQLAGKSVGIFPVTRGKAEDLHDELEHILDLDDGEGGAGISSLVNTMPVERLNSILVVSPRSTYIERVGQWIKELDSVEDPASESTLHIYEVLNGNAAQLASVLGSIYGKGGSQSGGERSQVAPGMTSQRMGGGGGGGADGMPDTGAGRAMGGSTISLGDSIRVVSDDYNNALLVYASPYEFGKIERILRQLDVVATQVLIEASIVEVTLSDDLQYGIEWMFQGGVGSDYSGQGMLNFSGGDLGPLAGFSYTVQDQASAVRAVVNALAEKSMVNVISTPSVLVLDNHTAAIHVGDQQPIQSRQLVTDGGNVQSSIEYKDTGVKLEVTPSVNDGGLVTLDVKQSVTDVGPVDTATQQRSFLERNVSSRVAVRNGNSVVLGGLIRDNNAQGKSGIPLLMDIPVLGGLFSTNTDNNVRTELLVFITPKVVESDEEMRSLSIEMKNRMRGLTDFDDLPIQLD